MTIKKLLLFFLLATSTFAQEATLNSPVARGNETKHVIVEHHVWAEPVPHAKFIISVRTAANEETRSYSVDIPDASFPAATINAMYTALDTVRSGETGSVARRAQFRLHGFLVDTGVIAAATATP